LTGIFQGEIELKRRKEFDRKKAIKDFEVEKNTFNFD